MAEFVDIAPALLEKLQAAFAAKLEQSGRIAALRESMQKGSSYVPVENYAAEVGELLAETLREHLSSAVLPDGRLYYNIADKVLRPLLETDRKLVSDAAVQTLNRMHEAAGIGVKAQAVPEDTKRVNDLLNLAAHTETYDDVAGTVEQAAVTYSQLVADETLKRNVDFIGRSGRRPKIIRTATGKCCEWCQKLAGTYSYPVENEDVYRRHSNCRCTVDYDPGGAKRFQNVHNKEWKTAEERAKIEARKQVGVLSSDGRCYAEDIIIGRSVGAKAKNYDILDPNTGEYFHFAEGTRIQNIEVFAGFGVKKPLNEEVALGLSKQIGGDPEKWQHCKGFGIIDYDGEERPAEVHWFQEESVGRDKFKVKRWLDEG